jgi:hypothetical protein
MPFPGGGRFRQFAFGSGKRHAGFQPPDDVEEVRAAMYRVRRRLQWNPEFGVLRGELKAIRHYTGNAARLAIYGEILSE